MVFIKNFSNLATSRLHACGNSDTHSAAVGGKGGHKGHICPVTKGVLGSYAIHPHFFRGHRLTGEGRFINLQVDVSRSRKSAGIYLPASIITISPGTTLGINFFYFTVRLTIAFGVVIFARLLLPFPLYIPAQHP